MPIVTLTTDFGARDTFVGTLKGVILFIAPQAALVDICHEIPPQDVLAGALALEEACPYFPPGTIHVAVVDPGVGGPRAALAIETERAFLVGPDNGLFDLVLRRQRLRRAVSLTNSRYHLRPVSATFHGRDIFAPAAAHLAAGVPLGKLGAPAMPRAHLNVPAPVEQGGALRVPVLRCDRFGNLVTALTADAYARWNPDARPVLLRLGRATLHGLARTFSDVPPGRPVAYFGSGGRLEIAVNQGRAADVFKANRITVTKAMSAEQ